jgi:hypothetical protein
MQFPNWRGSRYRQELACRTCAEILHVIRAPWIYLVIFVKKANKFYLKYKNISFCTFFPFYSMKTSYEICLMFYLCLMKLFMEFYLF